MKNKLLFLLGLLGILITSCLTNGVMKPTPTIDTLLQNKADTLLTTSMVKHKATSGKVIIMETATGYIKAMVGLERKRHPLPIPAYNRFLYPISNGTEAGSHPFGCTGNW